MSALAVYRPKVSRTVRLLDGKSLKPLTFCSSGGMSGNWKFDPRNTWRSLSLNVPTSAPPYIKRPNVTLTNVCGDGTQSRTPEIASLNVSKRVALGKSAGLLVLVPSVWILGSADAAALALVRSGDPEPAAYSVSCPVTV